jgi:hypothetical protein
MKRALSVKNLLDKKHKVFEFEGVWLEAVGKPQTGGTWFVYGPSKMGKTSFTMMLAKYLTRFGKVYYNSFEEGDGLTIQMAIRRAGISVKDRFIMPTGGTEDVLSMTERLKSHKSPKVAVIDTIQFSELRFADYKRLKKAFPDKIFVYVSHVQGEIPQGEVARKIYKDASVVFRIEGFKAFPVSRFGGRTPVVINAEQAEEYWGGGGKQQFNCMENMEEIYV